MTRDESISREAAGGAEQGVDLLRGVPVSRHRQAGAADEGGEQGYASQSLPVEATGEERQLALRVRGEAGDEAGQEARQDENLEVLANAGFKQVSLGSQLL
ncbi:MAG TPA: hypothetical protein VII57_05500, partial [Dehalococcoidia bacterium]